MKENQKQKIKQFCQKFVAYFAMYALLPILCGAVVGMLFLVRSVGAGKAEEMFHSMGEKTVMTALGGSLEESQNKTQIGFYFLSSELTLPLAAGIPMTIGTAQYFSPLILPKPESNPDPQPEDAPEESGKTLYGELPQGAVPVVRADLSSNTFCINTTSYDPDIEDARKAAFPCSASPAGEKPLVLVLHTHATECYLEDNTNLSDFAPEGVETYFVESSVSFRTENAERSVVKVGKVFSETLTSLGIPTLHCTVMHDKDDFNQAYTNAAETVRALLAQYPSIEYVIDLHRDSVTRGDSYVKSYTEIQGTPSAQVMLVVGSNQNGRHPNWRQNLTVATAYKDSLDTLYPSLSRALYLRTARFNQEFLPGCLLLEVGTAANTLEEAEQAARYAAEAFSNMLKEKQ